MPTIFDIKRFALHDGPGIRTTIFFKGCPLRCMWCHNPESQCVEPEDYIENRVIDRKEFPKHKVFGKEVSKQELIVEILRDRVFFEESGGGVTFSGGEPLMQYAALLEILRDPALKDIHKTIDTSGFAGREIIKDVANESDLFLYDLKIMDPVLHQKYTGISNELILSNADFLLGLGKELIFRIPLIPGINNTAKEIISLKSFLSERLDMINELHLLPYHRIGSDKYKRMGKEYSFTDLEEPSDQVIDSFKTEIDSIGLAVRIGG